MTRSPSRGIHRGGLLGYHSSPHTQTPLDIVNEIFLHMEIREPYEDSHESFEWLSHCPPENRRIGDSLRMRPEQCGDQKIARFHDHLSEYRLGTHIGQTIYKIF